MMPPSVSTFLIKLSGLVQGVGFRPFVWRLAREMRLTGIIFNDSEGVTIYLNADGATVERFVQRLGNELPPLARIDRISTQTVAFVSYDTFEITSSQQGDVSTGCAPDAATCSQCRNELFDPTDRRYRYPFINCTNCGPRLSIIRQIPYDREFTTMAEFQQCSACTAEYNDPGDRRFHAQPNACKTCGPQVWLEDKPGNRMAAKDAFSHLSEAIRAGRIVAIKGLGGFHLACDATNPASVTALRAGKHRPDKAFALMVRDIEVLGKYAQADNRALELVMGSEAPVVLLNPQPACERPIADNIAPGQYQLGFMLPYTPIHHLLLEHIDVPLVMTSGNRSGSPQAISNDDAREQLADIADLFLFHDRPIQNRVDDSVVRDSAGRMHYLRRARGYAPASLPLPPGFEHAPDLVALGGELKNTLCLVQSGRAIITQHLGDLEDVRTYDQYQATLDLYRNLYQFESDLFVCDLHPAYLSSTFGEQLAEQGKKLLKVQHHHAHLASCLGENAYPIDGKPVLGICLDGTGFGLDETLWGGEFLFGNYQQIRRLAHLQPFPLVGGGKAITEPWRCLYAQLKQALPLEDLQPYQALFPQLAAPVCATFDRMIEKELNTPVTSSAGRLFDAVAAALGCHADAISYEGQAAIELESLAHQGDAHTQPYALTITDNLIDPAPFWKALLEDLRLGQRTKADMALAFHTGFSGVLVDMVNQLRKQEDFTTIVLSGGVMQNAILFNALLASLEAQGFDVLTHQQLPANDAGLSFGQALIGAARVLAS